MADTLFHDGELRNALEGHASGMDKEIAEAPEDHLMHVDEDVWITALVHRYEIAVPQLLRDEWWMDAPEEIKVDVRYDGMMRAITDYDRPALVNGFRIVVHVPFVPDSVQDSQGPVHERSQQMKEMHDPDAHSSARAHATPGAFFATHVLSAAQKDVAAG